MKRIFLLFSLLASLVGFSQTPHKQAFGIPTVLYEYGTGIKTWKQLGIPLRDTVGYIPNYIGEIVIRPQDTLTAKLTISISVTGPKYWAQISGDGIAHNHGIANLIGTRQFTFGAGEDVRFRGEGNTSVSFEPSTKTVIISSVPGESGADGNNYPTALSYANDTLTLSRNGLIPLYQFLPFSEYLRKQDTTAMLLPYRHWSEGYLKNISGYLLPGNNIYMTGAGSLVDPFIVNAMSGTTCETSSSGGAVVWRGPTGWTYDVTSAEYAIACTMYESDGGTVTLDNPDSLPRWDAIVFDTTGTVVVIKGEPSATPQLPSIDPTLYWFRSAVYMQPGTTEPSETLTDNIYDEHTEEWVFSTGGTLTANPDNTSMAFSGVKSISITSRNNGSYLEFTYPDDIAINNNTTFSYWLRLINNAMTNQQNMVVQYFNNNTSVSNSVTASIQKNTVNAWQLVAVQPGQFQFSGNSFNRIRLYFSGSTTNDILIDLVKLQSGNGTGGTGTGMQNAYVQMRALGSSATSAGNDVFTYVSANNLLSLQVVDNDLVNGDHLLATINQGNFFFQPSQVANLVDSLNKLHEKMEDIHVSGDSLYVVKNGQNYFRYWLRAYFKSSQFDTSSGATAANPITIKVAPAGVQPTYMLGYNLEDSSFVYYSYNPGSGGGGAVESVFGRTGIVTAQAADYASFYVSLTGLYENPGWIVSLDASKITGLATVATTGDYNDLLNKPVIPPAQVNSDWNAVSGVAAILNKPTLLSQFTNDQNFITRASLSATAPLNYNNVTGAFSITQATTSTNGYLSSADWNTFNNKVPSTRTLTINGVAYDLSADRSWTITAGAADQLDTYTTGTTHTAASGANVLYVDPASTSSALTLTLPATPHSSNMIYIHFGGTITSGAAVTSFTISPNTGQGVVVPGGYTNIGTVEAGETLVFRYRPSTAQWYRQ